MLKFIFHAIVCELVIFHICVFSILVYFPYLCNKHLYMLLKYGNIHCTLLSLQNMSIHLVAEVLLYQGDGVASCLSVCLSLPV